MILRCDVQTPMCWLHASFMKLRHKAPKFYCTAYYRIWKSLNTFHLLRRVLVSSVLRMELGNQSCFLLNVHVKPMGRNSVGCLKGHFKGTSPYFLLDESPRVRLWPDGARQVWGQSKALQWNMFYDSTLFSVNVQQASIAAHFVFDTLAFHHHLYLV